MIFLYRTTARSIYKLSFEWVYDHINKLLTSITDLDISMILWRLATSYHNLSNVFYLLYEQRFKSKVLLRTLIDKELGS